MGKILIIDSDRALRQVIASRLRGYGFETAEASSGWAGLQMLENERFTQVLLSERLPDFEGFAALEQIHRRQPSLPVLFVLENYDAAQSIAAVRAGACECLAKPLHINRLMTALQVCKAKSSWQSVEKDALLAAAV